MDNTISKLNSLMEKYFSDISSLEAFEEISTIATTIIPDSSEEAFNLSSPYLVSNKKVSSTNLTNSAVTRGIFSKEDATKMVENESYFVYRISLLLNSMLVDLVDKIGNLSNRELRLKRPNGSYVEIKNDSAIEIRIYAEKENK